LSADPALCCSPKWRAIEPRALQDLGRRHAGELMKSISR
jgi:hypothetical protein